MKEEYTMTTTSYYPCAKCGGELKLVEHYYPPKKGNPFMLEYVVLTCEACKLEGRGRNESEAYLNLAKKL
ncbi:MAG: hypothetical protein QXW32_05165 [Nitrososphaerales archaeon]